MNPRHAAWVSRTRARRGPVGAPFQPGIVSDDCLEPRRAHRAAAAALAQLVGGRRAAVGFQGGSSYANLERSLVNLDVGLVERCGPAAWTLERLLGMAAHEGAHLLLSRPLEHDVSPLLAWVHNVVEDERIECEVARRYPALAAPLERLRRDVLGTEPPPGSPLAALLTWVRAPGHLGERAWAEHRRLLLRVARELEPFPRSHEEVRQASERIVALLPRSLQNLDLALLLQLTACGCPLDAPLEGGRPDRGMRGRGRGGAGRLDREGGVSPAPPVTWSDAPRDAAGYANIRSMVSSDVARFTRGLRALLPRRLEPRACTGRLDARRLWAFRTEDALFRSPGSRPARLSLAVIIDLSGSMRGASERIAQQLAVTIAEGAARVPGVRLHVYGHTADSDGAPSTDIVRFATPASGAVESLGSLPIRCNNRDAHAFEVIGRDLLRVDGRRGASRLALMILDGLPDAAGFSGRAAVEATRRSLERFERAWGPPAPVATRDAPRLRSLARGPCASYDAERPVDRLLGAMRLALARA